MMTIKNLRKYRENDSVILSAVISDGDKKSYEVYFKTDASNERFVVNDYSPFLALSLLPSMITGCDLLIEGDVSNKLYHNQKKIQEIVCAWNNEFTQVNVIASPKKDLSKSKNVACFFSLGVDAFYTFLKNQKTSKQKITHFILVKGFDVSISDDDLFIEMKKNVERVCRSEGVKLIVVYTNLRTLTDKYVNWDWEHGAALAATALFLRGGLKTVYLAGPHSADQLVPLGLHPEIDYLWSSESTLFVHDGLDHKRVVKIYDFVSKSELALSYLKVCWVNKNGSYNCGTCNKCIRTMVDLEIAGVLSVAKRFPSSLSLDLVSKVYSPSEDTIVFIKDSLDFIQEKDVNPELQLALKESIRRSRNVSFKRRLVNKVVFLDKRYNSKRLFNIATKLTKR